MNSGLSCPCFGWSFIGVPEYCLSFSNEFMKKKNCLHYDWTVLVKSQWILRGLVASERTEEINGRKKFTKPQETG